VVDTGGLALMDRAKSNDEILQATADQVATAIEDAAAVILVVDLKAGLQPLDSRWRGCCAPRPPRDRGRQQGRPARVGRKGRGVRGLGFPVVPVSAAHNRGAEALMETVLPHLPPETGETEPPRLKVAVVGRPNVGKSSYINRLTGQQPGDRLRRAGHHARHDRRALHAEGGRRHRAALYLVDTAGMRKQGRVHESVEKFSLFRAETASPRPTSSC
jgi:GTPase